MIVKTGDFPSLQMLVRRNRVESHTQKRQIFDDIQVEMSASKRCVRSVGSAAFGFILSEFVILRQCKIMRRVTVTAFINPFGYNNKWNIVDKHLSIGHIELT